MTATSATPAARLIGYVRVSTDDQDLALQLDALALAGVPERDTFRDHGVSGSKASRPGLDAMLAYVEPGDIVLVYKLDRLGRSTAHVVTVMHELAERGIYVRVLDSGLDNSTVSGRAMLQMLAVFADMEREFIRERTKAGLAVAKTKGHKGGRPPKIDAKQTARMQKMHDDGHSVTEVADMFKVTRQTVYRHLDTK